MAGIRQDIRIICHSIVLLLLVIATYTFKAESNVQHILISDPERGVPSYGLTEEGKQQAKKVRSHSS